MSDGSGNPLSNMPPWGWILIYMFGGGALGVGGVELSHGSHEPVECPEESDELSKANREIKTLKKAHESLVFSFNMMTGLLSECNQQ